LKIRGEPKRVRHAFSEQSHFSASFFGLPVGLNDDSTDISFAAFMIHFASPNIRPPSLQDLQPMRIEMIIPRSGIPQF
jgi:hypothetical protein